MGLETSPPASDATAILSRLARGESGAAARLLPVVYEELRAIAKRQMRREGPGQTLQPTALVHEAYCRLIDQTRVDWRDRTHFLAVAATMMRRVLVERARARRRLKRGGEDARRITLDGSLAAPGKPDPIDVLALNEALERLKGLHERQARVVEMRFFAGLEVEEVAHALGVSTRTVEDDWAVARAWLRRELKRSEER